MNLRSLLLFATIFASPLAHASDCTDWPTPMVGRGPGSAVTGQPLTYNFRFNCALGERYELGTFNASYRSTAEEMKPLGVATFPLASGELLYQAIFNVHAEQTPGTYELQGCQEIKRLSDDATRCQALPPSQFTLYVRLP